MMVVTAAAVSTVREMQLFSAFPDPKQTVLARKLVVASMEEAATDSAGDAWAASLGRMRRSVFGDKESDSGFCEMDEPWQQYLQAHFDEIKEEVLVRREGEAWTSASYGEIAKDWKFRPLWKSGSFLEDALREYPRTCAALEASGVRLHPWQDIACGIARLPAKASISRHCDGGLVSWTAHLALKTNPEATLTVQDESRPWSEGEWLVFDSSRPHEACNAGEADRYVLLLQPLRDDAHDDQVDALAHALEAAHPPLGVPHAVVFTPDGSAHSSWIEYAPHRIVLARGLPEQSRAVLTTPPLDDQQRAWIFRPRADATGRELPFSEAAPVQGKDFRESPALVGVDTDGQVSWLGFARRDTSAGRWLGGNNKPDLDGHADFLRCPNTAAVWYAIEDGDLLISSPATKLKAAGGGFSSNKKSKQKKRRRR